MLHKAERRTATTKGSPHQIDKIVR